MTLDEFRVLSDMEDFRDPFDVFPNTDETCDAILKDVSSDALDAWTTCADCRMLVSRFPARKIETDRERERAQDRCSFIYEDL